MKLEEILIEKQQLDEVPAGMIGQGLKKLGAKVLSKVPGGAAKSKAANLAGQADLGDTANNLHKEFNGYLGTQGKKMAQATGEDLAAFLKTKNHKTAATIPSGVLQKQQLDNILMTAAKEAMAGKGGVAPATANTASQVDQNNDGKDDNTGEPVAASNGAQKIEFVPNQDVLLVGKTGKPTAGKVVGKSSDGDESKVSVQDSTGKTIDVPRDKLLDPKTKKPFVPGQKPKPATAKNKPAGNEIPPELQKKIDALTPEQKTELASLL